jgi:hypothetical protein
VFIRVLEAAQESEGFEFRVLALIGLSFLDQLHGLVWHSLELGGEAPAPTLIVNEGASRVLLPRVGPLDREGGAGSPVFRRHRHREVVES